MLSDETENDSIYPNNILNDGLDMRKKWCEDMNKKYNATEQETRLKTIRENRGVSQTELAKLSGVSLRSIQMYEQKVNDIDKAQARTVYKLSRVLGCTVEDLLENPEW